MTRQAIHVASVLAFALTLTATGCGDKTSATSDTAGQDVSTEDTDAGCVDESVRCDENRLEGCIRGEWRLIQTCDDTEDCIDDACVYRPVCVGDMQICADGGVNRCVAGEWLHIKDCGSDICSAGECEAPECAGRTCGRVGALLCGTCADDEYCSEFYQCSPQ